ncbi:MAG: FG-GAP-like repeat-containing protein [Candidatus Eisenbacteria bacterium]
MTDIFISYAKEDERVAFAIALELERRLYSTWVFGIDSVGGVPYLTQAVREINAASVFLLLISWHSLSSDEVDKELEFAHRRHPRPPFFPVRLGVSDADFRRKRETWDMVLGTAVALDLSETTWSDEVESVVARIVAGMRTLGVEGSLRKPDPLRERRLLKYRPPTPAPTPAPAPVLTPVPPPVRRPFKKSRWRRYGLWLGIVPVLIAAVVVWSSYKPSAGPFAMRFPELGGMVSPSMRYPKLEGVVNPSTVVVEDFNGDGRPDIAACSWKKPTVAIFPSIGHGKFGNRDDYLTEGTPYALAAGDVDGDWRSDLVVTQCNGGVVVLLNGYRVFKSPIVTPLDGRLRCLTLGDLDRDGHLDALVAHETGEGPGYISVLLGDGMGTFRAIDPLKGDSGGIPALGDLNGDGILDVAVGGHSGTNQVTVRRGNGDGTFGAPHALTAGATFPIRVALRDLNSDGRLDLIAPCSHSKYKGLVSVWLGQGDGSFGDRRDFETGPSPVVPVLADLRRSGRVDLVTINQGQSNTFSILYGNGDGTFGGHKDYELAAYPCGPGVADFSGDGYVDLAVPCSDANIIQLLINRGAASHAR